MANYLTTIDTPLPADAAFAYMADARHFADWDPGVVRSTQVLGDGPTLGAEFDVVVRNLGRESTLRYRLCELDTPHRLVLAADTALLRSHDEIRVARTALGSTVTYDATLQLKGVARLAEPLLAIMFRRIGDRAIAGLRVALSARVDAP